MRRWWLLLLAWTRSRPAAICEISRSLGLNDLHTWRDSDIGTPWVHGILTCKRCGKPFRV
jgi:hypothetical protein